LKKGLTSSPCGGTRIIPNLIFNPAGKQIYLLDLNIHLRDKK